MVSNSQRSKRWALVADSRSSDGQSGVTLIEMLIVISMILILTGIAVFSLSTTTEMYAADDQANQVVNFFREANARAISNHHSYRVVINLTTRQMSMVDERTDASGNNDTDTVTGDDVLVKRLPLRGDVNIGPVTGIPVPPGNYPSAVFSSGQWCVHFQSNGSATSTMGQLFSQANPALVSCSLMFQSTVLTNNQNKTLIRAVTLAGATSSVRFWLYNGTAFIEG